MSKQGRFLGAARFVVPAVALILYIAGYVWYQKTVVAWWVPLVVAAVIALLSLPMLHRRWSRLTDSDNPTINGLYHFYIVCALFYAGLLGGNYAFSDNASARRETVTVVRRIERTRKEYRYLRHHRRVPTGKTIHSYYLQVAFADSTRKRIPVSGTLYRKTRANGTIVLSLQRGFLGSPVIKEAPVPTAEQSSSHLRIPRKYPQGFSQEQEEQITLHS